MTRNQYRQKSCFRFIQ